ncbi:uncharacterized protein [Littorina saxatilis]|uniref:uncharacterized protein n=1 Tax=Littorina saxatilis TaxID=31220 RepID=UPI0038B56519
METQISGTVETIYKLPGWMLAWFYATAVVCTWDASFIILRPWTLPGGSLFPYWSPYSLYIAVDQRYKDVNDPFVYGISLFNYLEVALNVITIILHYRNSRHTIPLAFTVTVMTFWKTLFYFYGFSELGGGAAFRMGNTAWEEFLLVVVPNGIWIIVPFVVMAVLWSRMIPEQLPASPDWASAGSVKSRMRSYVLHAKHA